MAFLFHIAKLRILNLLEVDAIVVGYVWTLFECAFCWLCVFLPQKCLLLPVNSVTNAKSPNLSLYANLLSGKLYSLKICTFFSPQQKKKVPSTEHRAPNIHVSLKLQIIQNSLVPQQMRTFLCMPFEHTLHRISIRNEWLALLCRMLHKRGTFE